MSTKYLFPINRNYAIVSGYPPLSRQGRQVNDHRIFRSDAPSERAGVRARRRARREGRIARRETYFDLTASAFSCERIAEEAKVSAATVRRELDRAIAEQRLDAPERYAHLQVARLNKALRVADGSIEKGDMKAVGPFLRVVAALDRYHGLAPRRPARAPTAAPPLALPAPPLALTHAAAVPSAEPPFAAEAIEDGSAP